MNSIFCGEMLVITFLLVICTIVLFHIQKNEQRNNHITYISNEGSFYKVSRNTNEIMVYWQFYYSIKTLSYEPNNFYSKSKLIDF